MRDQDIYERPAGFFHGLNRLNKWLIECWVQKMYLTIAGEISVCISVCLYFNLKTSHLIKMQPEQSSQHQKWCSWLSIARGHNYCISKKGCIDKNGKYCLDPRTQGRLVLIGKLFEGCSQVSCKLDYCGTNNQPLPTCAFLTGTTLVLLIGQGPLSFSKVN